MRVLLAGATGFTGRRIAASLVRAGHDLCCFVRAGSDLGALAGVDCGIVRGDLDAPETLRDALAGRDALVYAASLGFGHGPSAVRAAVAAGIERAVFFSTTAIFTRLPASTRAPRMAAEMAICESLLDWTILRPTMIYGAPGDRNVERLLRAVHRWPALPVVAGGERLIQPVLVDDLAAAATASLANDRCSRRAYSLPGRAPVTFGELIRLAGRALGRPVRLVSVPAAAAVLAAGLAEKLLPSPRIRAEQVLRLLEDKDFEWSAAARDLGYRPASVEEGLRLEVDRLGLGGGR